MRTRKAPPVHKISMIETPSLPRLLYLSDVPAESTVAGAALIFRLLETYPADRLLIIQSNLHPTSPPKRLARVRYETLRFAGVRMLKSRYAAQYALLNFRLARWRYWQVRSLIREFRPEAVATVAHGSLWLTADAAARRLRVPLHLIIHDDVPTCTHTPPSQWPRVEHAVKRVYRAAASRLCVSPSMAETYSERYGAAAEVLYPSRASDARAWDAPPLRGDRTALRFFYAGSINTPDYIPRLAALADQTEQSGDQLVIYSPIRTEEARDIGLARPNITVRGFIPFQDLLREMRESADVLFVPMSFAPRDRPNMEISFPSKIADYTVTGLPLLIWGPPYCSAVRWAKENPGVAEVVESSDPAALHDAVGRLRSVEHRRHLGETALRVGAAMFGHAEVAGRFFGTLRRARGTPAGSGDSV